jgi:glycosyltransferase involved in cell wall biosynthesis
MSPSGTGAPRSGGERSPSATGALAPRRPLRLAYLSIGRHIHTSRWLTWFSRRGHEVHLLTVQPGPIESVRVHDITPPPGPKPLRYALGLIKVRRILKRLDPDLLHTHFLTGYGYWGVFSGWRPFVLTVWGDDVYVTPHQNRLKKGLARRALRGADYITGDSRDILDGCIRLGAPPDRLEVIQWGVDFEVFNPSVSGDGIRSRLGVPDRAPIVLSTRSFTQPYYNIDLIITTAAEVRKRVPEAHYVFAGLEGTDDRFRDLAREAGLTENVHWVGRIPHGELPSYLNAATVFVTVPSVDATAVSLLEAMACRCGIVATDLPSAREWIRDQETGLTVRPRDSRELTAAILRLIEDSALREKLGRAAEACVRLRADHDQNMARVEEIYYSLCQGRPVRPPDHEDFRHHPHA